MKNIEFQKTKELFRKNQLIGEEFSVGGLDAELYKRRIEIDRGSSSLIFMSKHIPYVNAINDLWAKTRTNFVCYAPDGGLWHGEPRILIYPQGVLEESDAKIVVYEKDNPEEWRRLGDEIDFPKVIKSKNVIKVNDLELRKTNDLFIEGKKVGEDYEFLDSIARLEKFWVYYQKNNKQMKDANHRYDEGFKSVEGTELMKEMFEMWQTRRGSYAK